MSRKIKLTIEFDKENIKKTIEIFRKTHDNWKTNASSAVREAINFYIKNNEEK